MEWMNKLVVNGNEWGGEGMKTKHEYNLLLV
jgi:hypothetical protein